ncbi:uncharacterized protein TRIVIDRAFT_60530 [Trichoderma virens Gv29-8]|uniref:DUF7924 domain-containing protein n=1 Tax=Hypocrea virens (strain Gv29-8 / FGSC 10586) TaxID=413071 RepID=G9MRA1_HYPVG|nr:uncharacterized protein TRIVIDRAFT_60530 [Trichoderma virens Gv29-8]EHK22625.1 hypothetical protein TRIVIDRAFT_60530 [Trichoderma virens Gv29-8]UKZ47676.1 hypothetical protein TrVGV298_001902 [Trichoderma virens]
MTFSTRTCQKIRNRNEARVLQDISRLIVPSAESLTTYGAEHLEILSESVNEGWNNSIPLTGTLYGHLLHVLSFLACEVKCGAAVLDVADRQNAHSMTLAARGIVELFRLVKRENEVHRQILSFYVSHDHRSVRSYSYYPVIDGKDAKYYRQPVHEFSFAALEGKDKWTAYQFTKNAIDQLTSQVDFDVQALSESTGLSQRLENLARPTDSAPLLVEDEDQASKAYQMDTPATSFSKIELAKRRKRFLRDSAPHM